MYGRNLAICFLSFGLIIDGYWKSPKCFWSLPLFNVFKNIFGYWQSAKKKTLQVPSFLPCFLSCLLSSSPSTHCFLFPVRCCDLESSSSCAKRSTAQQRFLYCSLLLYHFLVWRVSQRKRRRKKKNRSRRWTKIEREREVACVGRRGEQHYDGGGEK